LNLLQVIKEIVSFLQEQEVPYAVIGGLAVQYWGEPRFTRNVDILVMVREEKWEDFLNSALKRFSLRIPDGVGFAHQHRVLLLKASDGTPIDISLGIPGYEEEVLRRAVRVSLEGFIPVNLVSAEDLIIHKCVAGRARDVEDVESILIRQKLALHFRYIRKWLKAFEPLIDTHSVTSIFEEAVKRARNSLRKNK